MAEGVFTDGEIVDWVLDQIGWDADKRDIDYTLGTSYPKWWTDKNGLQIIQDLELISLGFFYVDRDGNAVWRGRSYRALNCASSEGTFTNQMVDLQYELHDRDIYNKITILADYEKTNTVATQTTGSDTLVKTGKLPLESGGTKYWYLRSPYDEVVSCGTPRVYFQRQGTWNASEMVLPSVINRWANTIKVKLYNSSKYPVPDRYYKVEIYYNYRDWTYSEDIKTVETEHVAEDTTSQEKYGIRAKRIDLPFRLNAQSLAEDLVQFYLAYYKEPVPMIRMTIVGSTAYLLAGITALEIDHRITIVNTRLGLNTDFYINKVTHECGKDLLHKATYDLVRVTDVTGGEPGGVWILGLSELGTNTILDFSEDPDAKDITETGWAPPRDWVLGEVVGAQMFVNQIPGNVFYFDSLPNDFGITEKAFSYKCKTGGTLTAS